MSTRSFVTVCKCLSRFVHDRFPNLPVPDAVSYTYVIVISRLTLNCHSQTSDSLLNSRPQSTFRLSGDALNMFKFTSTSYSIRHDLVTIGRLTSLKVRLTTENLRVSAITLAYLCFLNLYSYTLLFL